MDCGLISIIIPVYDVEKYLTKCLDSILAQTYSNYEVLLVDDGSPDCCGEICDEYETKDQRFRAIHIENLGVSVARNIGLSKAKGNYIGFVDPDDYIENTMFEKLIQAIASNNADIVVCGYSSFGKENGKLNIPSHIYSCDEAMFALIENDHMPSYLWNKVFKRELFEGISFPQNMRYEDVCVMHKLFLKSNQVYSISDVLYHYFVREDSITGKTRLNKSKELIDSYKQRANDLESTKYYSAAQISLFLLMRRIILEIISEQTYKDSYCKKLINNARKLYGICKYIMGFKQRTLSRMFLVSPVLYEKVVYKGGNLIRKWRR